MSDGFLTLDTELYAGVISQLHVTGQYDFLHQTGLSFSGEYEARCSHLHWAHQAHQVFQLEGLVGCAHQVEEGCELSTGGEDRIVRSEEKLDPV